MELVEQPEESGTSPSPEAELDAAQQYEMSAFQDEVLLAIAHLESDSKTPTGAAIKKRIQEVVDEYINSSQLYPNLDELADRGFISKGDVDDRTNRYHLTPKGRQYLNGVRERFRNVLENLP